MDLYFERHDGHAVECDDFRAAMADANNADLKQFERWYSQAGTPIVNAEAHYDAAEKTYTLTLAQSCPATPGQKEKLPFHIPVAIGLLDGQGRDTPLRLQGGDGSTKTTQVLALREAKQSFIFTGINDAPVPSLLRDFSAPVTLKYDYTDADLAFLMAYDSDPFNRWEAGQRLAMRRLLTLTAAVQKGETLHLDEALAKSFRAILNDDALDPAFREVALTLPSETMVAENMDAIDPQAIFTARRFVRKSLAESLRADFERVHAAYQTPGAYSPDAKSAGKRSLKNLALSYLIELDDAKAQELAQAQFDHANNMSDRTAALSALINSGAKGRNAAVERFYKEFAKDALVIDKWFVMQGAAHATDVARMRELMKHPAFTLKNPNRARSLLFSFCNANAARFHAADGSGYAFWSEQVIALNAINPQVASRLARSLDRWRKYTPALQKHMQAALRQIAKAPKLSRDVHEVIDKALAG
jgi:aminopeptidase N